MIKKLIVAVGVFCVLATQSALAQKPVELAIAGNHGCALYDDGGVWCWGLKLVTGHDAPPLQAYRIDELPPAKSIAAGRFGACAIDQRGALWCWGLDCQRSLRTGKEVLSHVPFRVEKLPPVRSADLGFVHQCAVSEKGNAWCWGSNPVGELGCGDTKYRADPVKIDIPIGVRSISTGVNNTCASLENGYVACWGSDAATMEGRYFIFESKEPVWIKPVTKILKVANGRNFACGLRSDGKVTCWGSNVMKQLGTEEARSKFGMGGIDEVDGIKEASDVAASYFHACAVERGKVICWGMINPGLDKEDKVSAIRGGAELPRVIEGINHASRVSAGEGDNFSGCAIDQESVMCWGSRKGAGEGAGPKWSPYRAFPVKGLPK